jgi:hypothetical protein
MVRPYIFLLLVALSSVLFSCRQEVAESDLLELTVLEADTVQSFFGKSGNDFVIQNEYFKPYQYEVNGSVQSYIFKIKESEIVSASGNRKNIELSPVYSSSTISAWNISSAFDDFTMKKNVLTGEMFATDEQESSFYMYNIDNGKLLMEYTYGNLEVHFPDGISKRYFGFYSQKGRPNSQFQFNNKDIVGYFTYASDKEKLQVVEVKVLNPAQFQQMDKNSPMLEFEETENPNVLNTTARTVYYSGIDNLEKQINEVELAFNATFYIGENYTAETIVFPLVEGRLKPEAIIYNKALFQLNFK